MPEFLTTNGWTEVCVGVVDFYADNSTRHYTTVSGCSICSNQSSITTSITAMWQRAQVWMTLFVRDVMNNLSICNENWGNLELCSPSLNAI